MDLASTFLNIVEEYGFYSALGFAGVYSILYSLKGISNTLHKLTKKTSSLNCKNFRELVKVNFFIGELLKQIKHAVGSDRAIIVLYHNGEHSIGGYSFTKMSCIHECIAHKIGSTGKQLRPIQKDFTNIPISAFSTITKRLFTEGNFTIVDMIDLKKHDLSTYEEFKRHGVRSARFYPLVDSSGHIFGFICFEFKKKVKKAPSARELLEEEKFTNKISSIIELISKEINNESTDQKAKSWTSPFSN